MTATTRALTLTTFALFLATAIGCAKSATETKATAADPPAESTAAAEDAHDHSGWWCNEHGVPEGPIRLRRSEGPGADDWQALVAEIT